MPLRLRIPTTFAPIVALLVAACADEPTVAPPTTAANPLFARYVAVGNSITAGFQSAGINDSTQRRAYPALLARQMGTDYVYPALAGRGCPPPLADFTTQARVGANLGATASTCDLRDPSSLARPLNNVAVPGATSFDPNSANGPASNTLTFLVLGGKSQVDRAIDARPTFVTVGIVGNDILSAVSSGVLVTPAGVPTFTPPVQYAQNYAAIVNRLRDAGAQGGVLQSTVDLLGTPVVVSSVITQNPQLIQVLSVILGVRLTVHPSCTGSRALFSVELLNRIRSGEHPPIVACAKNSVPGTPVGDAFVLDEEEQATVNTAITQYNTYIRLKADSLGWAYYDINPTLRELRANGNIAQVPDLTSRLTPFGPYMSLDPVHPGNLGHQRIANDLIAIINQKYGTTLARVP
ncbi:MAG: SGNH/GDSL hydrolase family protein [Gemmatimonadaceae bacterium]|jgi:lysophospholipase L1-like esterase|nr:SGNH/GDSL hydrolase family protein [Gemmatimonadaceae bacterium]